MSDAALLEAERRFLHPTGQEAPIDFDCPKTWVYLDQVDHGTLAPVEYCSFTEVATHLLE